MAWHHWCLFNSPNPTPHRLVSISIYSPSFTFTHSTYFLPLSLLSGYCSTIYTNQEQEGFAQIAAAAAAMAMASKLFAFFLFALIAISMLQTMVTIYLHTTSVWTNYLNNTIIFVKLWMLIWTHWVVFDRFLRQDITWTG